MNRTLVNFWLNTGLLFAYAALFWSSIVLHIVFPPGPDTDGWTLWGWSYLEWRGFQFANVVLLTLGVLLHVMLHWSWVCGVISTKIRRSRTRPDEGTQTLYGVALLIGILILVGSATAAAKLSLQPPHRGATGSGVSASANSTSVCRQGGQNASSVPSSRCEDCRSADNEKCRITATLRSGSGPPMRTQGSPSSTSVRIRTHLCAHSHAGRVRRIGDPGA